MIPSQRAYGLLLLGVAIATFLALFPGQTIAADIRLGLALFGLLIFDFVVFAVTIWDGLYTYSKRVKVKRQPLARLSIGRENPVALSIQSGNSPARIQIRDEYPQLFKVSRSQLQIALAANSSHELTYTITPDRRGEFRWGNLQIRQLGAWGLAWHQWKVEQSQTVAIYPDLIGLRDLSIRLTLKNAGNLRQSRRIGLGTEFAELRHYNIGDDPRLIDWKATARRGLFQPSDRSPLLVRVLEPEQEQTLIVLLDRGRLMTAQVEGLKRFDWGLNATLSLALAGLSRGDRVGVAVFDRDIHTWIPPERGKHQLSHLLEKLTPIQPVLLEPDYVGAVAALTKQQTRRALVVVVTDLIDVTASSELLASLGRLAPRYLPFCVTLRDPQIDVQAHSFNLDVTASYARAVALDLLAQRQVAFGHLQQRGVLVLDAPASQISNQLVDRYLRVKAQSRL